MGARELLRRFHSRRLVSDRMFWRLLGGVSHILLEANSLITGSRVSGDE